MQPIDPKLLGSWVSLDELDESEEDEDYSPSIFTISSGKDGYEVAGISPSDGEAAKVTNIGWDGEKLSFDCIFPSTDYPTKQAISLLPDGSAHAEYTIWETWKKIPVDAVTKMPAKLEKTAAAGGAEIDAEFIGIWVTEEEDSDATFAISQGTDGYEVAGFDRSQGESFVIKDVVWDGTALKFEVYLDDELLSRNAFTLLTDGTADLQLTLFDIWTRAIGVETEESEE